jgi:hypothetical protein
LRSIVSTVHASSVHIYISQNIYAAPNGATQDLKYSHSSPFMNLFRYLVIFKSSCSVVKRTKALFAAASGKDYAVTLEHRTDDFT